VSRRAWRPRSAARTSAAISGIFWFLQPAYRRANAGYSLSSFAKANDPARRALVMESKGRGVLDAPAWAGHDGTMRSAGLPDGQIARVPDFSNQPSAQKFSASSNTQINLIDSTVSSPQRGAYRDRHGRWDEMRWTRLCRGPSCPSRQHVWSFRCGKDVDGRDEARP
jgi:hypothetical protein